jgi:hypothetical protein
MRLNFRNEESMKVFTIQNPAVVAFRIETLEDAIEHGGLLIIAGEVNNLNADGLTVTAGGPALVGSSGQTARLDGDALAPAARISTRGGRRKRAGRKAEAKRGGDNLSDAGRRKLSRLMKARHAARKAAERQRKAKRTARKAKAQPQAKAAAA